jgi:cellulose synthase/poly-beta-1,6-N-acetylglucosamine synthase-like glycosyltransferase
MLLEPLFVALLLGQAVLVAFSLYQTGITLAGYVRGTREPRERKANPRFLTIVCARNEAPVVSGIVRDLLAQDYPRDCFQVVVVAHNCTDDTAAEALAAGALVVERETDLPGKSHAIAAGLSAHGEGMDYVGVFDADSRIPPDLLSMVANAAGTHGCIQTEAVPEGGEDWLSSGHGFARRARNLFWWRPRAALGLSTTISGTGFFVRTDLLEDCLPRLRTLTEDLEMTVLFAAAGERIVFLPGAMVVVGEPHEFRQSVRQRLRWVRGHIGVVRNGMPSLLGRMARGDYRAFDLAVYLVMPSRVITRTGVTAVFGLAVLQVPFGVPLWVASLAMAGEWVVPLTIAVRERLFPLSREGVTLAARHTVLSLLWFPIGIWALVTSKRWEWSEAARVKKRTEAEQEAQRAA